MFDLITRILTSIVGLIVFFAILFITESAIPLTVALCLVISVMLFEVYLSVKAHKVLWVTGYISAVLIMLSITFSGVAIKVVLPISLIIYLIAMVYLHNIVDYKEIMSHYLLTYYITFFMGSLIMIRNEYGVFALLLVFVCAWITDTGAYFSGRFFGKHKLIPKVSPKKTVEGAIGGTVLCVIAVLVYVHVLDLVSSKNIIYTVVFALIASVLSQFGDLVASSIKRDSGIKDFGNLLPGHGGLTDRFDSVMFIAPIILYLLKLI